MPVQSSPEPPPTPEDRAGLVARFAGRRIVVVGDVVLDEYLIGRAARLSREAPVPVLELVERSWRPGAAGNPAANVAALGGQAVLIGVVGEDEAGKRLRAELARASVDLLGLVETANRTTAIKTRILATHASAHPQQVARIDDLPGTALAPDLERRIVQQIEALVPSCETVLVSNYRGGVVTPAIIEAVVRTASAHGIPTCVDSQGDLLAFRGFTLVKSNQPDAEVALAERLASEDDFRRAGARLLGELGASFAAITRGGDGMSVIGVSGAGGVGGTDGADGVYAHLEPTNRTEVWDVTGAGDTVIAVLALGLAAGLDTIAAARIANAAAGLVVRRIGVATVSLAELVAALEETSPPARHPTMGPPDPPGPLSARERGSPATGRSAPPLPPAGEGVGG